MDLPRKIPLRTKISGTPVKVMRGELREEIFACSEGLAQEKQGIVVEEGKI